MLGLFKLLEQLNNFDAGATDALPALREMNLEVFLSKVPHESDHLLEDVEYCLYQMRNAACALCACMFADQRICGQMEYSPSMKEVLEFHVAGVRQLGLRDFERLIGTAYQEASFWSLWTVCAACRVWDARALSVLGSFQRALSIASWHDVETTLQRYAYQEEHLGSPSRTLFENIQHSSEYNTLQP